MLVYGKPVVVRSPLTPPRCVSGSVSEPNAVSEGSGFARGLPTSAGSSGSAEAGRTGSTHRHPEFCPAAACGLRFGTTVPIALFATVCAAFLSKSFTKGISRRALSSRMLPPEVLGGAASVSPQRAFSPLGAPPNSLRLGTMSPRLGQHPAGARGGTLFTPASPRSPRHRPGPPRKVDLLPHAGHKSSSLHASIPCSSQHPAASQHPSSHPDSLKTFPLSGIQRIIATTTFSFSAEPLQKVD